MAALMSDEERGQQVSVGGRIVAAEAQERAMHDGLMVLLLGRGLVRRRMLVVLGLHAACMGHGGPLLLRGRVALRASPSCRRKQVLRGLHNAWDHPVVGVHACGMDG